MRSLAATALAAVASARFMTQQDFDFIQYIAKYGKSYADVEEFNLRAQLFAKFDADVKLHNATETTSVHGHNFLSDWTAAEKTRLLGLKNMAPPERPAQSEIFLGTGVGIPASVDWVTAGKVNPIQNQGHCASCWAFSATAAMESAHAIFHTTLYKLSEQNFVSCTSLQGNHGCNGGNYGAAWNYAKSYPVESEANYPYTSGTTGQTGSCTYNATKGIGGIVSHTTVATDTTSIKTAIAQQPQSVSIEADTAYFQSYTSGVLTNATKCGTSLDHAVVAVGYGTDATAGGYYLVRNSWGTSWGEKGYVKIGQAAAPGICGINKNVQHPTVTA
jgi:C1A family cysteine protease